MNGVLQLAGAHFFVVHVINGGGDDDVAFTVGSCVFRGRNFAILKRNIVGLVSPQSYSSSSTFVALLPSGESILAQPMLSVHGSTLISEVQLIDYRKVRRHCS